MDIPFQWREVTQRLVEIAALDADRQFEAEDDIQTMVAALRSGSPELIDIDRLKMKWGIGVNDCGDGEP